MDNNKKLDKARRQYAGYSLGAALCLSVAYFSATEGQKDFSAEKKQEIYQELFKEAVQKQIQSQDMESPTFTIDYEQAESDATILAEKAESMSKTGAAQSAVIWGGFAAACMFMAHYKRNDIRKIKNTTPALTKSPKP